MRKLPSALENPADDLLLAGVEALLPLVAASGLSPNAVTLLSGVLGAAAVGLVGTGRPRAAALAYLASYFLDCLDGHLARSTGRVSREGDAMDHLKDWGVSAALAWSLWGRAPPWALAGLVAAAALSLRHFGCQERYYGGGESSTLGPLQTLCAGEDPARALRQTRWFGSGTATLAAVAVLWVWG